uniref:Uncharacterized protein n=1 Tax=Nelumbo nucifera TaxID=4432 RepID=A0A822YEG9_NELNU|nr:TPA_asm: hypothetical protein HUJ06_030894 [Nelumbo nucifera]
MNFNNAGDVPPPSEGSGGSGRLSKMSCWPDSLPSTR